MGRREHVYVHLRKRSQNMHNIHTPRNGDRIRRGFFAALVKGDHRWTRKIMQTVAITKTARGPTCCRLDADHVVHQSENAVPKGYTCRDSKFGRNS